MKKRIFSLILVASFIATSVTFVSGCGEVKPEDYVATTPVSYVTLNVNPSIELVTDTNDRVVAINSVNDDGEAILSVANYYGYKIEDATIAIARTMAQAGYIEALASSEDSENAFYISVVATTNEIQERVESKIKANADDFFRTSGIFAFAVAHGVPDRIDDLAYNIFNNTSSGNLLFLMLKAMSYDPDLSIDDVADLNYSELMNTIRTQMNNMEELHTQTQKQAYLAARETLQEGFEQDLATLFNDASYDTLLSELATLIADYQYAIAHSESITTIVEAIQDKQDAIDTLKATLIVSHSGAYVTLRNTYQAQVQATLSNYADSASNQTAVQLLATLRTQYEINYNFATQSAGKSFEFQYDAWKPVTTTEIDTFMSTTAMRAKSTVVENTIVAAVQNAIDKITPYNAGRFGDSETIIWTLSM
ncbi:MAG: hypothetical protein AB7S44_03165 [Spirochaetales bacterium]